MTLPSGKTVVQVHSPALAVPKPGTKVPAAVVPVPAPPKVRAIDHKHDKAPVSHRAKVVPAHVVGRHARAVRTVALATVEQFDSVNVARIPAWSQYVAGYVDGRYQTYRSLFGRFPVVTGIAVSRGSGADCFDMEPGNPPPDAAGPWAKWQLTQGNPRPCEYSMLAWMPAIRANLKAWGIPLCGGTIVSRCVRLWDANWTHVRHLDVGYFCTQWTNHAFGINLDESTCAASFFKAPKVPGVARKVRVVCFGKRAQLRNRTCRRVRARVAKWQGASASTHRALAGVLRQSAAYMRLGVTLSRRARFFDGHISTVVKQYS